MLQNVGTEWRVKTRTTELRLVGKPGCDERRLQQKCLVEETDLEGNRVLRVEQQWLDIPTVLED